MESRYQRRLSPVAPSEGFIAGDQFQLNAVPDTQIWNISEWSGGEGNDRYVEDERDVYYRSSGVRPKPTGEGLILGALGELTKDSGGSIPFADGGMFGHGSPTGSPVLLSGFSDFVHAWDPATVRWIDNYATGAGAGEQLTSMANVGAYMYSGHRFGRKIWRWNSSGSAIQYGNVTPFLQPPVVAGFRSVLYALEGDNLYEVSTAVTETRSLKVDTGATTSYPDDQESWDRLTVSDKGPFWVQRLNSGECFLWEYNAGSATGGIIGQTYHVHAYPYDVAFVAGAYVVAYRAATTHSGVGDAFLHVQRGDTRSVVPFRSLTGSTASKPIVIAGVIGSDLVVYFDGAVWAYNLDSGGVYMLGARTATGEVLAAAVSGGDVFLSGGTGGGYSKVVERVSLDRYMASGTIESGRFDVRYPGLPKLLTEVTVTTEPLPASTSVQVAVASDGGSYVALAGTHDVDGATSYTFVGSTASASIIGREFEIKLTLGGTSTATPTVLSVSAVVTGAAHLEEWVMELDVSDVDSPASQAGWDVVDQLRSLAASQQVVTFENPWEQRGTDDVDSVPVRVLDVIVPQGGRRNAYATVRVRRTQLVVG